MQTLDASKQKLLNSDRNLLNAGGGGSANKSGSVSRPVMPGRSKSNLAKRSNSTSNG